MIHLTAITPPFSGLAWDLWSVNTTISRLKTYEPMGTRALTFQRINNFTVEDLLRARTFQKPTVSWNGDSAREQSCIMLEGNLIHKRHLIFVLQGIISYWARKRYLILCWRKTLYYIEKCRLAWCWKVLTLYYTGSYWLHIEWHQKIHYKITLRHYTASMVRLGCLKLHHLQKAHKGLRIVQHKYKSCAGHENHAQKI